MQKNLWLLMVFIRIRVAFLDVLVWYNRDMLKMFIIKEPHKQHMNCTY